MILIENILQEKKHELERLINMIKDKQVNFPDGSLRISKDRKHFSYFHYLPAQKECYPGGKYISKKDKKLICSLAQKDYDAKVLTWAMKSLENLENLLAIYKDNQCADIYENLGTVRKELVNPYELTKEMLINKWQDSSYKGKELREDSAYFVTEKGEKVRSKSEKILADYFQKRGIPYKYEYPLELKKYGTIYPDFTILNIRTGQVFYWEHFGMMDNQEYVEKVILKINSYEQNGIFPGKNLLMSYEIKNNLNMQTVDALIQEFLI